MKTLLFFHRLELTEFYIQLNVELKEKFKIIHVAYSNDEEEKLKSSNITVDVVNFKKEIANLLDQDSRLDHELLGKIDKEFIELTTGRFTLNGSIQSDRGFNNLKYNEALLLSQTYYKFWEKIITRNKIDYVMHEPVSLSMNHICSLLCKKYDAKYIYQIMSVGSDSELNYLNISGDNYECEEIGTFYDLYNLKNENIDLNTCRQFLNKFRSNFEIYCGSNISSEKSIIFLYLKKYIRNIRRLFISNKKRDRLIDNIECWLESRDTIDEKIKNLKLYKKYKVFDEFDELDTGTPYYFYPFHLEPEAVVLYLADGLYTNQIQLIKNIAAQLPVGSYLYVKDHPHENGYRSVFDYLTLKNIPNVKLLSSNIAGKKIIKNSIGVFTINGTAGFEALLMGKQVYTFGKTFYEYCPRVTYIHDIRDVAENVYSQINRIYETDDDLLPFVGAYLSALHFGMVDYFAGRSKKYNINQKENAKTIANDFSVYSRQY